MEKEFRAVRHGGLLVVRGAVGDGKGNAVVLRLLVDTGSSHAVAPVEVVETLGCDTQHPLERVRIVSANGVIVAPRVAVPWFQCLGEKAEGFPVVAHTLPPGASVDGRLGMDFLSRRRATICLATGKILCPIGE